MNWFKKHLYLFPVLLYIPALGNFFSGDDWFHLRISQISSFQEFFNFFSFFTNDQSASFYRPLSTQVFFFVFQKLFGLTAWPYYLFGLVLFGYSLHLVYKFALSTPNTKPSASVTNNFALIATLIYGISTTNFTRIYFLSAYQELFLVIFSLLALLNFAKKPIYSALFFILALLSKETAIVIPPLIFIFNYSKVKNFKLKHHFFLPLLFVLLSLVYLYLRFYYFGFATVDSYLFDFHPSKVANTLMWYILWSFGAPELLVDYVGSGLKLVPRFFTDYIYWWRIITYPLILLIISSATLGIKKIIFLLRHSKSEFITQLQEIFKFLLFFLISLLPVLFLPFHKFTLELGLPMIGFSLFIAWLLPHKLRTNHYALIFLFIAYNLSMSYLTYTRHYSVSRGKISQKVYNYFYPRSTTYPSEYYFEFINDSEDNGPEWGQSRQISQSLSGSDFFKVYYNNSLAEAYYEDFSNLRPVEKKVIPLSTDLFVKENK